MASAKKKKIISKKKSKQNSSTDTKTILPKPKLYPLSSKKPEGKIKQIFHAVGVMKTEQESYHEGVYSKFTPEQIHSHIPQYNVVPYSSPRSKDPKPLSAARMEQQRSNSFDS